jgi:hypothetical protein
MAAYIVADLPSHSCCSAFVSCAEVSAHSPHPVSPERVFTRKKLYRLPETGSCTGNQRISAIVCSPDVAIACGANAALKRILRSMVFDIIGSV